MKSVKSPWLVIWSVGVLVASLFWTSQANSNDEGPERKVQCVQFDSTLELISPITGTRVLLFARYWASPEFYRVAVVWAEPHIGSLNYPTYPPGFTIGSDHDKFELASQISKSANRSFRKPMSSRGAFEFIANNYPIANVRYAERDALAWRVFRSDLSEAKEPNEGWVTSKVHDERRNGPVEREIDQLRIQQNEDGEIASLVSVDRRGREAKRITYDYSLANGISVLNRMTAILNVMPIPVRLTSSGRGALRINGQEATVAESEVPHHSGARRCTVAYDVTNLWGRAVSLPSKIEVRKASSDLLLRTATISNYVPCALTEQQCEEAAKEFCRLNPVELRQRALLIKYWAKPASDVNGLDLDDLKDLRCQFEGSATYDKSVGEKLKRINMMMEIDLMLGDHDHLLRAFGRYLETLRSSGLLEFLPTGGLARIDTAVRWRQFEAADRLLDQWRVAVVATQSPESILTFAGLQARKGHCWAAAELLKESLSSQDWAQERSAGQVLLCTALHTIRESLAKGDSTKEAQSSVETEWVGHSLGVQGATKAIRESIREARRSFGGLKAPTKEQEAMERQVASIEKGLVDPNQNVGP